MSEKAPGPATTGGKPKNFYAYLEMVRSMINPKGTPEHELWPQAINTEFALRAYSQNSEIFRSSNDASIRSAAEAFKALILVNGGSSVAMLAFLGTMASKDHFNLQQITTLARPLIWFASGVGLGVASSCFSWFANFAIASTWRAMDVTLTYPYIKPHMGKGLISYLNVITFRTLTICAALGALYCFGQGVWTAKNVFEQISVQAAAKP
jgi:hypothetical protein